MEGAAETAGAGGCVTQGVEGEGAGGVGVSHGRSSGWLVAHHLWRWGFGRLDETTRVATFGLLQLELLIQLIEDVQC